MKEGWQIKKLGEVCDIYQPTTVSTKNLVENGKYLVYGANGVIGRYNQYNHENSEVLLTCRGNTCGTINVSEPFAWINGNAMVVRPKGNILLKSFLRYCLLSIDYSKVITGAAQPQITRISLAPTLFAFPSSLSEQQRIVALLDAEFAKIDALKANAEKNLQNAKDLFQAALKKELEPKEGWKVHPLKDVSQEMFAGGDAPKDSMSKDITPKYQIPIYANAVEKDGLYGFTDTARVRKPSITIAGRGSGTGHVIERSEAYFPIVRLIVILPKEQIIGNRYLYYAIRSLNIKPNGSAIPQLTIPMIANYPIPYPDIEKQSKIVARLDALSEKCKTLQANYEKTLSLCDDLKQALLRKAFNGEI